jgi:multidrug efflux pump subunit AcrB
MPARRYATAIRSSLSLPKIRNEANMKFNISAWAIRNPLATTLLAVGLVILGLQSFSRLPVTRLPNVDVPIISVTVTQFGAAPAEIEAQVTKTIEDAVSGIEGVQHIASSIGDWVSITTIELRLGTDTDRALNEVKDAISRVRGSLRATSMSHSSIAWQSKVCQSSPMW